MLSRALLENINALFLDKILDDFHIIRLLKTVCYISIFACHCLLVDSHRCVFKPNKSRVLFLRTDRKGRFL